MGLNDDEVIFFEKLNLLNIRVQTNLNTQQTRLLLHRDGFESMYEILETTGKERERIKINLIRSFLEKNRIKCNDQPDKYEKHGLVNNTYHA